MLCNRKQRKRCKKNVGGLIGNQNVLGTTVNCYTKTNVISEKDSILNGNIGGLIGIAGGSVIYCYASGNVKGKRCCGGLLGEP